MVSRARVPVAALHGDSWSLLDASALLQPSIQGFEGKYKSNEVINANASETATMEASTETETLETSLRELSVQDRLAAYKAKAKKAAKEEKKKLKQEKKKEKERIKQENLAKTWAHIEAEKKKAKEEWDRVKALKTLHSRKCTKLPEE